MAQPPPPPGAVQPPPPPGAERRVHPRHELYASVRVTVGDDETLLFYARNISLGGILLAADEHDVSLLPVGSIHEMMVFDAADEHLPPVHCRASVIRHIPGGIAFMWATTDPTAAAQLAHLLGTLRPLPH